MSDDHAVSALAEQRGVRSADGHKNTRYRGRCSCGVTTFMHYSTPDAAETALRRTHLTERTKV